MRERWWDEFYEIITNEKINLVAVVTLVALTVLVALIILEG